MIPLGDPLHALATADAPHHAGHRKALLPQLAARRIRDLEPWIAETFDRLWAERGTDWMASVANRLPMVVVARLIGVPVEDVDRLMAGAFAGTTLLDGLVSADDLAAAGAGVLDLAGYCWEHMQRALAEPRDDLLGDLARWQHDQSLDPVSAQTMMITLFSAGGESTGSMLGSAVEVLATQPEVQHRVREDPTLMGAFIEEVLRFEPPFRAHYRHVSRDTSLRGVDLPGDARLLLLWGSANRDPEVFDDPDAFRLDRPNGKEHVTFGKGAHFCVGAALARLEAAVVLPRLLERTTWIEATDVGPWLPSLLVRRRSHLHLTTT